MDKAKAEAAVKAAGGNVAAAARALGVAKSTVQKAMGRHPDARRNDDATIASGQQDGLRGFAVGEATRCASKKPSTTVRARFYSLKRGMAYKLVDVAREWVLSEETVKRHAQDADCFRYVEMGKETWEPCVMHPDTAKNYPVK
jgi:hypothetical protein